MKEETNHLFDWFTRAWNSSYLLKGCLRRGHYFLNYKQTDSVTTKPVHRKFIASLEMGLEPSRTNSKAINESSRCWRLKLSLLFWAHVSFALGLSFKRKRMRLCLFMHDYNRLRMSAFGGKKHAHACHWKLAYRVDFRSLYLFLSKKKKSKQNETVEPFERFIYCIIVIESVNLIHIFIICIALQINCIRIAWIYRNNCNSHIYFVFYRADAISTFFSSLLLCKYDSVNIAECARITLCIWIRLCLSYKIVIESSIIDVPVSGHCQTHVFLWFFFRSIKSRCPSGEQMEWAPTECVRMIASEARRNATHCRRSENRFMEIPYVCRCHETFFSSLSLFISRIDCSRMFECTLQLISCN